LLDQELEIGLVVDREAKLMIRNVPSQAAAAGDHCAARLGLCAGLPVPCVTARHAPTAQVSVSGDRFDGELSREPPDLAAALRPTMCGRDRDQPGRGGTVHRHGKCRHPQDRPYGRKVLRQGCGRRSSPAVVGRRIATSKLGIGGGYAVGGYALPLAILEHRHGAERSTAETHRPFQHPFKHRRQVTGRGVDDGKHFGGCGLLLQRLARLGQQPRVVHRDDRLRGEVLQHRYRAGRRAARYPPRKLADAACRCRYRLEGADLDPFPGGVRHFSRAFSRSATSVAPSSRARRYQDKAASKSPRAPRRTGRFRKTGSKVSANLTAPWASPASAARS